MKIRMLRTQMGSTDGCTLRPFECGQVYDLSGTELERSLAGIFLRAAWAEEARPAVAVEERADPVLEVPITEIDEPGPPHGPRRRRRGG